MKPTKPNIVRGRSTAIRLENLVNRLKADQHLLATHPEEKELLERQIQRHIEMIAQCVVHAHDMGYANVPFCMDVSA